jgi:hypothetical protein
MCGPNEFVEGRGGREIKAASKVAFAKTVSAGPVFNENPGRTVRRRRITPEAFCF